MKPLKSRHYFTYNFLWYSKHFLGEKLTSALFGSLERANFKSITQHLEKRGAGKKIDIDTYTHNDFDQFGKTCLKTNRPAILKGGASHWPAIKKWDIEFFKENYGHVPQMKIKSSGSGQYEDKALNKEIEWTTLKEVIESFDKPNFGYASFNPIVHKYKELKEDFDYKILFKYRNIIASGTQYQLFIGKEGSHTDLHSTIVNNYFIQVAGKKRWRLYHPDWNPVIDIAITREPCFHSRIEISDGLEDTLLKYADYQEFELEAGDIFYNPPFQWHRVENIGHSIGLAFKWTSALSFTRQNITQAVLTTCSTNPYVWNVLGSNGNYMNTFIGNRKSIFAKLLKRKNQKAN